MALMFSHLFAANARSGSLEDIARLALMGEPKLSYSPPLEGYIRMIGYIGAILG